jgi:hypothetical protein
MNPVVRGALRITRQRLRNQWIIRPSLRPEKVVEWFGAVQAQEYGPAKWGLALRSRRGTTSNSIDRVVDEGRIVRTHVLRPTWHFVTPADLRWMLELTAPQVHRAMSSYNHQLGLDADIMTRAAGVIERALGDGGCLTRRELGAELDRAGLPGKSTHLAHLAMYAELEGVICSGPRRGKQFTYALLADRAPAARRLARDEAIAELTRRHLRSHGPATIRDFVWWSGLKTADARRGLQMVRARSHDVGGLTYWTLGGATRFRASLRNNVQLLPVYDEYLVAYRDHQAVPRPAYSLGGFQHALVIAGLVAGAWRTIAGPDGVMIDLQPLRRLAAGEKRALDRAVARYGEFLGVSATRRPGSSS